MVLVDNVRDLGEFLLEGIGSHDVRVPQFLLLHETYRDVSRVVDVLDITLYAQPVELIGKELSRLTGVVGGEKDPDTFGTQEVYRLLRTWDDLVTVVHSTVQIEYRCLDAGEVCFHGPILYDMF